MTVMLAVSIIIVVNDSTGTLSLVFSYERSGAKTKDLIKPRNDIKDGLIHGKMFNTATEDFYIFVYAILNFERTKKIQTICDFGLNHGDSAKLFMSMINPARYIAFDKHERMGGNVELLRNIRDHFKKTTVLIRHVTVNANTSINNISCDLIHVDLTLLGNDEMNVAKNMIFYVSKETLMLLQGQINNTFETLLHFFKTTNALHDYIYDCSNTKNIIMCSLHCKLPGNKSVI